MTELVPADQIEELVGARRHPTAHLGRVVSAEDTVYILHSRRCRDSGIDLRDCRFSRALDRGRQPGMLPPRARLVDQVLVLDVDDGGDLVADPLANWLYAGAGLIELLGAQGGGAPA